MDRLAVNLAGAFVKSIFPDMDRSAPNALPIAGSADPIAVSAPVDVRRAPQHTQLLQEASGPAFDTLSAFNNRFGSGGPAAPILSAVNNPNYGLQLPSGGGSSPFGPSPNANLPLPTSQLADLIPLIPNNLNAAGPDGIEAINAARRHKYLSELQSHQNQLNDYSAKQLEYLDQQRRYQQQMVDHQAGAAVCFYFFQI
uniref:Uncharacterized protein n=1 Tax=Panagrolaimus superbus TaxID=310955 RepID=A0A914Y2E5_9BILA